MNGTLTELERGRGSYASGSWRTAFESLTQADQANPLEPDDLELLARSAYMLGRDDDYVDALVRAHQGHLAGGNMAPAVRCAIWIGHSFLFRGQATQAGGWFARAHRLLDRVEGDCVEHGYALIPVWLQQMGGGDLESGYSTLKEAEAIAERFDDADLLWLARDDQARALLALGRVEEGLRLVEEILVATTAAELSPFIAGIVYCNTIAFCRDCFEFRHAREWTAALTRWCEQQPEMVAHNGLCLVHKAEVMQLTGAWDNALDEARGAAQRFTEGVLNQIALGQAHYRLGEIHRLRGDLATAEDAYRAASQCGFEPQPGMALLRVAQGNAVAGAAAVRRAVAETVEPLPRARLLPAYVEIMLEVGDPDAARAAVRELDRIAERQGNEVLSATAAHLRGLLALNDGDADGALAALRQAISTWQTLETPYELARTRELVASAFRSLGDDDGATLELDSARRTFEELGAQPDLTRLDAPRTGDRHGLTVRELEVLRLVSSGKSNRDIAAELVISEHTVARHVQNIFVKLGVTSRTAAGAFAFENGLL